MYGQNLGVRPDAPGELIFTKFCVRVLAPDVFLSFEFQKDRMKNVGAVGSKFPLSYSKGTSLIQQLVNCYRTRRDYCCCLLKYY